MGPRRCVTDQLLTKADVIRAMHELVQHGICFFPRRAWASAEPTTSSECMITPCFMKKKPPKLLTKLGKGHSKDSSQGLPRTAQSKPRSVAVQSGIGYKKSVASARPAHLGAFVAAKPRILDVIRNAAAAGLLPGRLDAEVEAASAAFLGALDDSENSTARLYLQEAAQATKRDKHRGFVPHACRTEVASTTKTRVQAVSQHRTTTSQTYRKFGQSETTPRALLAFTPSWED